MNPMTPDTALRERTPGTYVVNEIFYSIQGEGVLAGTPMVFVRFADCNLRCAANNSAGFDCDTEFMSGREMTLAEINSAIFEACNSVLYDPQATHWRPWLLLTGGEPALQVDDAFMEYFGCLCSIAIETNGTIVLPQAFDLVPVPASVFRTHVCVSPKTAEHTLRRRRAAEVKYVRRAGQAIPQTTVDAKNYLISPAAQPDGSFLPQDLQWCIQLVKENPTWRLSIQMHKLIGVR